MELDVTHMVEQADEMIELSGSAMEHGERASAITWANSLDYGQVHPLLETDDQRNAARAHFREYGAWSEQEIAAWSESELQAIMCQDVAAAIREMDHYDSTEEYQEACKRGEASSRIYPGVDGKWYFYLGM